MINDSVNKNDPSIIPICLSNTIKTDNKKTELSATDKQNFLKIYMNDMKKKLEFIDNTNWMFHKNFDVHFLQSIDPTLIDPHPNLLFIDMKNQ